MKKIIASIFSLSLVIISILLLTSCTPKLSAPANVRLDTDTLTLSWNRVAKAKNYTVSVSGEERVRTISKNTISLEYLDPGEYTITIVAVGDGIEYLDSDAVVYEFIRETESGLRYKAINNNTEYQLVGGGTASGDVVMDDTFRGKPVTSIADKALASNSKITSFKVGKYVKTIGKNAFSRCSSLTTVTFDENAVVTSIGEYAFQSSKLLSTITLPDSLKVLPSYLFSWCAGLESVTLGANTTTISPYTFSNCDALLSITLPSSVKTIGEYSFSDCKSMTEITFGDGLETIDAYAFYNCEKIGSLSFGNNLTSIGEAAFGNCKSITSVTIPDSCKTIGDVAFRYCTLLNSVKLGNGLTFVGANVFANTQFIDNTPDIVTVNGWVVGCNDKKITEVVLPEGVYGIASGAFYYCRDIEYLNLTGIKYVNSYAFAKCDQIKNAKFDDALLEIGDFAFYDCTLLIKVSLGKSLVSIGNSAFQNCSRLDNNRDSIDLPTTLTHIGSSAFLNTYAFNASSNGVVYIDDWAVDMNISPGMGMTDIVFNNGTRGIADYACNGAMVLFSINMPSSVEYIGKGAFYKVYLTSSFSLPKNLKSIGDYAFYGCTNAWFGENGQTVIPYGTEYIGRSAFYECMMMTGVTIPDSVTSIGDYAFFKCENLGHSTLPVSEGSEEMIIGTVDLGNGVQSIGAKAFYGCTGIVDIALPENLTYLGTRAFYKCEKLTTLTIGTKLTAIEEYTFYNCSSLSGVTFPASITTIGRYAFRGCSSITELVIGSGVTTIGDYAFYGCTGISNIILPSGVASVGNYAFRGCSEAEMIIIADSVKEIGKHAFYGADKATVWCEADSIPAYWNPRWNTSYRPVVWGVELSADGTYVVSFEAESAKLSNVSDIEFTTSPTRVGYTFDGFTVTLTDGTVEEYTHETLTSAPAGATIHLVWTPNPVEESNGQEE